MRQQWRVKTASLIDGSLLCYSVLLNGAMALGIRAVPALRLVDYVDRAEYMAVAGIW
jgi:hypothetical protein